MYMKARKNKNKNKEEEKLSGHLYSLTQNVREILYIYI